MAGNAPQTEIDALLAAAMRGEAVECGAPVVRLQLFDQQDRRVVAAGDAGGARREC